MLGTAARAAWHARGLRQVPKTQRVQEEQSAGVIPCTAITLASGVGRGTGKREGQPDQDPESLLYSVIISVRAHLAALRNCPHSEGTWGLIPSISHKENA